MPASLSDALLPFQKEGVKYAIARQGRTLIADEMGVGDHSTLCAIACLHDWWPLCKVTRSQNCADARLLLLC